MGECIVEMRKEENNIYDYLWGRVLGTLLHLRAFHSPVNEMLIAFLSDEEMNFSGFCLRSFS